MTATSSIRDGNSSVRIADGIRAEILNGIRLPGSRLRQDEIAEQYGASRLPVKEALRILESDGLITIVANTGAWVSRLSLDECVEMYQLRERIEPLLLRYSLPKLSANAIDTLGQLADEMERARSTEAYLKLDREFHLLSYSGAETAILGETVRRLWDTTQHYRWAYMRSLEDSRNLMSHYEHRMIAHDLKVGDIEGAERTLSGHVRRTRVQLARYPELFDPLPDSGDLNLNVTDF